MRQRVQPDIIGIGGVVDQFERLDGPILGASPDGEHLNVLVARWQLVDEAVNLLQRVVLIQPEGSVQRGTELRRRRRDCERRRAGRQLAQRHRGPLVRGAALARESLALEGEKVRRQQGRGGRFGQSLEMGQRGRRRRQRRQGSGGRALKGARQLGQPAADGQQAREA